MVSSRPLSRLCRVSRSWRSGRPFRCPAIVFASILSVRFVRRSPRLPPRCLLRCSLPLVSLLPATGPSSLPFGVVPTSLFRIQEDVSGPIEPRGRRLCQILHFLWGPGVLIRMPDRYPHAPRLVDLLGRRVLRHAARRIGCPAHSPYWTWLDLHLGTDHLCARRERMFLTLIAGMCIANLVSPIAPGPGVYRTARRLTPRRCDGPPPAPPTTPRPRYRPPCRA